jgi:hypothetical protein
MLRALFLIFGGAVLVLYLAASWLGWEFASAGRNSFVRVPFISGGGYRGGK